MKGVAVIVEASAWPFSGLKEPPLAFGRFCHASVID
jgi:hypothetical protein